MILTNYQCARVSLARVMINCSAAGARYSVSAASTPAADGRKKLQSLHLCCLSLYCAAGGRISANNGRLLGFFDGSNQFAMLELSINQEIDPVVTKLPVKLR